MNFIRSVRHRIKHFYRHTLPFLTRYSGILIGLFLGGSVFLYFDSKPCFWRASFALQSAGMVISLWPILVTIWETKHSPKVALQRLMSEHQKYEKPTTQTINVAGIPPESLNGGASLIRLSHTHVSRNIVEEVDKLTIRATKNEQDLIELKEHLKNLESWHRDFTQQTSRNFLTTKTELEKTSSMLKTSNIYQIAIGIALLSSGSILSLNLA